VEPTKQELSQQLTTAARSMEHMNSLLHETEATNAVLMEQVTVCINTTSQKNSAPQHQFTIIGIYLKQLLVNYHFFPLTIDSTDHKYNWFHDTFFDIFFGTQLFN
jgi:hypothetical protein